MSLQSQIPCLTYRARGKCRFTSNFVEYKPYNSDEVLACFSDRAFHELFHVDPPEDKDGWLKASALVKAMKSSREEDNIILFTMQNISVTVIKKEDFEKIFQDASKPFEDYS